jgi:hypothetical protein
VWMGRVGGGGVGCVGDQHMIYMAIQRIAFLTTDVLKDNIILVKQHTLKNVNSYWNTNISFYLETSGGQNSNLYINVFHFSTPVLIKHLWQLKAVVFLHRCLIRAILIDSVHQLPFKTSVVQSHPGSLSVCNALYGCALVAMWENI